jgi:hypothetical protein
VRVLACAHAHQGAPRNCFMLARGRRWIVYGSGRSLIGGLYELPTHPGLKPVTISGISVEHGVELPSSSPEPNRLSTTRTTNLDLVRGSKSSPISTPRRRSDKAVSTVAGSGRAAGRPCGATLTHSSSITAHPAV